MLSIHRLTQEAFKNWLGTERRRHYWLLTSQLLNEAFPKLVNGLSMRPKWPTCKAYIAHVLILCRRYEEEKFTPERQEDFDQFLELSTSCGWQVRLFGVAVARLIMAGTSWSAVLGQKTTN